MQEEIIYGKINVIESINTKDITKVYFLKEGSHKEIVNLVTKKKIPYVFTDRYQLNK